MFGTIRRYRTEMTEEERLRLGRQLAARLSDRPGFVACVVLEESSNGCVSIELFEERSGLLAADAAIVGEPFAVGAVTTCSGEAIFQKGL